MSAFGREIGWRERLSRGTPLAVLLAAGLLITYQLLPVLELVAIAMLLALVIRTALNRLRRIGLGPWVSVSVLLGAFAAFGAFVWLVLEPRILQEVHALAAGLPGYVDSLAELSRRLHANVGLVPDTFRMSDRLTAYLNGAINSLPNLLLGAGNVATSVVATLILAVFMSHNPEDLISGALRFVPPERRGEARRFLRVLAKRLRGWMVGTGLAMIFVATGAMLGLWLLGAPLPITFGLLAGLLNVVPYVGSIVGGLLPALLALTISPVKALLVVVLFVILNQIDGYVIQPMVMGNEVRLHPVVVLLSFLFLGRLLGAAGLLLAVPTAVFLKTVADEFLPGEGTREESDLLPVPATRSASDNDSMPS